MREKQRDDLKGTDAVAIRECKGEARKKNVDAGLVIVDMRLHAHEFS